MMLLLLLMLLYYYYYYYYYYVGETNNALYSLQIMNDERYLKSMQVSCDNVFCSTENNDMASAKFL